MAVLDIVVLLLVGTFGVRGVLRGFVKEVLSLGAVAAGVIAIFFFHGRITDFVSPWMGGNQYIAALLTFVFIFGTVYVAVRLLASTASSQIRNAGLGFVDRALGLGFGAIKGMLIATVCFVTFTMVYDALFGELSQRPDWMRLTRSYPLLNAAGEAMSSWVAQSARDGGLTGLGEKPKADGEAFPINEAAP